MPIYTIFLKKESYTKIGVELTHEQIEHLERKGISPFEGLGVLITGAVEKLDKRDILSWKQESPRIVYWENMEEDALIISNDELMENAKVSQDDQDQDE